MSALRFDSVLALLRMLVLWLVLKLMSACLLLAFPVTSHLIVKNDKPQKTYKQLASHSESGVINKHFDVVDKRFTIVEYHKSSHDRILLTLLTASEPYFVYR